MFMISSYACVDGKGTCCVSKSQTRYCYLFRVACKIIWFRGFHICLYGIIMFILSLIVMLSYVCNMLTMLRYRLTNVVLAWRTLPFHAYDRPFNQPAVVNKYSKGTLLEITVLKPLFLSKPEVCSHIIIQAKEKFILCQHFFHQKLHGLGISSM